MLALSAQQSVQVNSIFARSFHRFDEIQGASPAAPRVLLRSVRCTAATRHLPDTVCLRYAALCSTARHRALSESANTVLSPVEELTLLTPLSTLYNKMLLDCGACLLHSTCRGRRSSGSLADAKLELAGAVHEVVRSIERTGCEACSTLQLWLYT